MTMDLQRLKSHLWDCAEILRGSAVDRTDWKAYILPLLFFKRLSDVWDEETAEAAALFGDAEPVEFPEVHRFVIPEGCHWRDVRETPANIGAALDLKATWKAFEADGRVFWEQMDELVGMLESGTGILPVTAAEESQAGSLCHSGIRQAVTRRATNRVG